MVSQNLTLSRQEFLILLLSSYFFFYLISILFLILQALIYDAFLTIYLGILFTHFESQYRFLCVSHKGPLRKTPFM